MLTAPQSNSHLAGLAGTYYNRFEPSLKSHLRPNVRSQTARTSGSISELFARFAKLPRIDSHYKRSEFEMRPPSECLVNASDLSEARIQEMVCMGALLRRAFDKSV